jgi:hypothetical protein
MDLRLVAQKSTFSLTHPMPFLRSTTKWNPERSRCAVFSACERYRYSLIIRDEPDLPLSRMVAFIGLNPSTADEMKDDPTVRRCRNFARDWGYAGGIIMLNAYGYRATKPVDLFAQQDPVGAGTDAAIRKFSKAAGLVVACWGAFADDDRVRRLQTILSPVSVNSMGVTLAGAPRHPLYLKKDLLPLPHRWQTPNEKSQIPTVP